MSLGRAGELLSIHMGWYFIRYLKQHDVANTQWRRLIGDTKARNMESGLVLLVSSLLSRMAKSIGSQNIEDILEYVLNNAQAWEFPKYS